MPETKGTKKKVLIIDDDVDMRRLISFGVTRSGYDHVLAENGVEAIQILTTQQFDVILVDIMMPVMDGLRFLRWLKQEVKSTTPVIVLTSTQKPDLLSEVKEMGAAAFVEKPVKLVDLLARMNEVVSG